MRCLPAARLICWLDTANVTNRSYSNYDSPRWFRVRTAGVSLLEPLLTIVDASGRVLGQAQSTNALGDEVDRGDPAARGATGGVGEESVHLVLEGGELANRLPADKCHIGCLLGRISN